METEQIMRLIYAVGILILVWPAYRHYAGKQKLSGFMLQVGGWIAIALVALLLYSLFKT